jgi:uncharacterized membrane protein
VKSASAAWKEEIHKVQDEIRQYEQKLLHPVHARYHGPLAPLGIRLANAITGFMGSWTFLILQTILVSLWIGLNVLAYIKHFDPYPFILLNLAFSTQAAYAAPLILMAGNVSAAKDRELWENDYATNQRAYAKIEDLERQIQAIALQNQELLKLILAQQERESDADPTLPD